jgi:hypothetical protein
MTGQKRLDIPNLPHNLDFLVLEQFLENKVVKLSVPLFQKRKKVLEVRLGPQLDDGQRRIRFIMF